MTWVDYAIIAIVVVSVIIGLFRGFVREIVSLVVWVSGIALTLHYLPSIEDYLMNWIGSKYLRYAVIVVALLVVILVINWLIGKLLKLATSSGGMGFMNRFLGLIFGFVRGTVIVAFLLLLVPATGFEKGGSFEGSSLIPTVQPLANWLGSLIPQSFSQKVTTEIKQKIREVEQ